MKNREYMLLLLDISLYKNECCPCVLSSLKLPHFLTRTVRKHFQYVMLNGFSVTKIEILFV